MTSAAAQPAMPIVIPVRLFGMDSEGKPFIQLATARNLTREHAVLDLQLLGGVRRDQLLRRLSKVRADPPAERPLLKPELVNKLGVQAV